MNNHTPDAVGEALNFRGETFAVARQQLVNVLVASKGWLYGYAEAYVDEFADMAREASEREAANWNLLCNRIDTAGESEWATLQSIICDARALGAGALEMHLDEMRSQGVGG